MDTFETFLPPNYNNEDNDDQDHKQVHTCYPCKTIYKFFTNCYKNFTNYFSSRCSR